MTKVSDENIAIFRKLWKILRNPDQDYNALMDVIDENITWEIVPLGLKFRGLGEMKQFIEGAKANHNNGEHEITNLFASEEWVCVEYTVRGTITKELKHLNINHEIEGQKIESRAINVYHIKNGKVDVVREYYDHASVMRQLGVKELPDLPV